MRERETERNGRKWAEVVSKQQEKTAAAETPMSFISSFLL